jgi:hypothetical protein
MKAINPTYAFDISTLEMMTIILSLFYLILLVGMLLAIAFYQTGILENEMKTAEGLYSSRLLSADEQNRFFQIY